MPLYHGYVSRAWSGGSTRQWRRVRARVLERDGNRCQLRIEGVCTVIATEVHHTHGKALGDDERYLTSSCRECNNAVGDPSAIDPEPYDCTQW